MKDVLLRCTGEVAPLRFILADVTQAANELLRQHQASHAGAILLAETAVASLFLSCSLKSQGSVSVEAHYEGDLSLVKVDSTPMGLLRGMIPASEVPKMATMEPQIGLDIFKVIKTNEKGKILSEGIVKQESYSMGKNLANYLLNSEQIRSGVGIQVKLDPEDPSKILYAIGYMVEAFPDCKDKELIIMEEVIKNLPPFSDFYSPEQGFAIKDLLDQLSGPFSYTIHREMNIVTHCPCSEERMLSKIGTLGTNEILQLKSDTSIEVICDFCRMKYDIDTDKLTP